MTLLAGITLWIGCIAAGFGGLQRYAAKAGPSQAPGRTVAGFFSAHREPGRPLLVMVVHPLCPCTDASLAELGDLLARSKGMCDALLLQYHPLRGTAEWPIDMTPHSLAGVRVPVLLDTGGKMGGALGAETSGHVVLVDADGVVRFHGGLTIGRGHRGRSPGQDAILEIVAGGRPTLKFAPVYGCAFGPECGEVCKPQGAQ